MENFFVVIKRAYTCISLNACPTYHQTIPVWLLADTELPSFLLIDALCQLFPVSGIQALKLLPVITQRVSGVFQIWCKNMNKQAQICAEGCEGVQYCANIVSIFGI